VLQNAHRGSKSQGDAAMSIYVLRGRYSSEALKGMIASPEDREAAIAKIVEKAGGKLLSYYVTFGDDDWLVIIDCPNNEVALSIAIVGAAGGSNMDTKTTIAMTSKQAMAAFKSAGELAKSFKSAGR
jgi:uncharacterized protein with GYD domain